MLSTNHPLNAEQKQIIGNLLVEILQGEVSDATRESIARIKVDDISEPYQHLVSYTQGWVRDNVKLAHELRAELRSICEELEDTDDSHNQ
jgi:hypothetical protein